MQVNDMLEYGDKVIKAFRDGAYDAAYDCVLKDVSQFIKKLNQWQKILLEVCFMSFLNHHQLIMQGNLLI